MSRDKILAILTDLKPQLGEHFGITRLGVFGSVARGRASDSSDVDVVVEMPPDLFAMVRLKERLEQALEAPVDVVRYRPRMNAFLKQRIDSEACYV